MHAQQDSCQQNGCQQNGCQQDTDPHREPVGWLRCFRGIDTLTAILLLAELHDVQRFPKARALMAYLGLVPGEYSSGGRHRRGPITKTGSTLARRLVVEAAWHYRHRPGVGPTLAPRRSGQPGRVIALADKAQQRCVTGDVLGVRVPPFDRYAVIPVARNVWAPCWIHALEKRRLRLLELRVPTTFVLKYTLRTVVDIRLPTAPRRNPFSTVSRACQTAR